MPGLGMLVPLYSSELSQRRRKLAECLALDVLPIDDATFRKEQTLIHRHIKPLRDTKHAQPSYEDRSLSVFSAMRNGAAGRSIVRTVSGQNLIILRAICK